MTENFARQEYQLTLEELRRLPHFVRQNAYGQVRCQGHMGIADAWAAALCFTDVLGLLALALSLQGKMHLYLKPMVQDCALQKWGTAAAIDARRTERQAVRCDSVMPLPYPPLPFRMLP
jgi:hypothetical protein